MGPDDSYICLIPPAPQSPAPPLEEQQEDIIPAKSWALLKPLSGKCLYHRQPWFTYSYCHNQQIRQFRELAPSQPHPPGAYEPQEDPEWESYTLGRAPPVSEPGVDLTVAQESAVAANLELAREAGSRYLVQRWGDGEICDKTGKRREVEVQFHCSMTTTDSIILVREAKTCSYVLVIHTPRLCGEPGFKSRIDSRDESYIRCREIVESIEPATDADSNPLTASDRPLKEMSQRQPLLTVPSRPPADSSTGDGSGKANLAANDRLRKVLEAVLGSKDKIVVEQVDIGGVGDLEDLLFEFELGDLAVMDGDPEDEVKGEKTANKKEKKKKEEKKGDEDQPQMRDEL